MFGRRSHETAGRRRRLGGNPLHSLFFRIYAGAMLATIVTFALIVVVYHTIYASAYSATSVEASPIWADEYHRITTGWHTLVEQVLTRHPPAEWPDLVADWAERFPHPVELVSRSSLGERTLPAYVHERLAAGQHATWARSDGMSGEIIEMFSPLPESDLIVVQRLDLELPSDIFLMAWQLAILAGVFGFATLALTYPVYRHINRLAATAAAFGDGNLQARAETRIMQPIGHLAESFNAMADRIQRLGEERQATLQAISHELRTPIARLHFALDLVQQAEGAAARHQRLYEMSEDLEELDQLVEELLTYSRLHRDAPPLEFERFDLGALVGDLARQLAPLAPSVELEFRGLQVLPCVGSPRYIRRAVSNVLRNAQRYAKRHIEIRVTAKTGLYRITVDDDGCGIPASERSRVFQPFTRLDSSRQRSTGGHGLGLAIVQRVMQTHAGEACIADSPLGGARVALSWPQPPGI